MQNAKDAKQEKNNYSLNTMYEIWRNVIPKNTNLKITNKVITKHKSGEILINQYIYREEDYLGKGFYGTVYKIFNKLNNTYYACKVFNRTFLKRTVNLNGRTVQFEELVNKELMASSYLNHEYLLKAFELIDDPQINMIYFILELCERELCSYNAKIMKFDNAHWLYDKNYLSYRREPNELRLKVMFREIAEGIAYLHRLNLAHCDIKPQNIMLHNGHVKIADFGSLAWTNPLDPHTSSYDNGFGTPYFFAPEAHNCLDKVQLDKSKLDIWAMGMTFFVCSFGELPFESYITSSGSIIPKNFDIKWSQVNDYYSYSQELKDFLEYILNIFVAHRPSIFDILRHEYLQSSKKSCLKSFLCSSEYDSNSIYNSITQNFFALYGLNNDYKESFDDNKVYKITSIKKKNSEKIVLYPQSHSHTGRIDHLSSLVKNSSIFLSTNQNMNDKGSEFSFGAHKTKKNHKKDYSDKYSLELLSYESEIVNSVNKNQYETEKNYKSSNSNSNQNQSKKIDRESNRRNSNKRKSNVSLENYNKLYIENSTKLNKSEFDNLKESVNHKNRLYSKIHTHVRNSDSNLLDYYEIINKFNEKDHILYECIKNLDNLNI